MFVKALDEQLRMGTFLARLSERAFCCVVSVVCPWLTQYRGR
jgi:hypothetical protein